MTRAERLLELLQQLRQSRSPVSADTLAARLRVSPRTVYRDIESLRRQGADIRGEAGIGFVLHQTRFLLPPLMFDEAEIEALVFGMRWTLLNADEELTAAAQAALAKIRAVLPEKLSHKFSEQALFPGYCRSGYQTGEQQTLSVIRTALRDNRKLSFDYTDAENRTTRRTVWPLAVGYFSDARLLVAWCEMRQTFRHFRPDRMSGAEVGGTYPVPRMMLLNEWQRQEGVDLSRFDI